MNKEKLQKQAFVVMMKAIDAQKCMENNYKKCNLSKEKLQEKQKKLQEIVLKKSNGKLDIKMLKKLTDEVKKDKEYVKANECVMNKCKKEYIDMIKLVTALVDELIKIKPNDKDSKTMSKINNELKKILKLKTLNYDTMTKIAFSLITLISKMQKNIM